MTAMANHLDTAHDQTSHYLWREGSNLLGDLKATQALDLLISHLAMDDGDYSESMAHQPALWGVIKIGSSAVPKLENALVHSPDPAMRWSAIYCLSFIGGHSAVMVLRRAFPLEHNECLSRFIDVSIKSLSNKQYKLKDTGKWSLAFACP
jgi:HEAT repeat protein